MSQKFKLYVLNKEKANYLQIVNLQSFQPDYSIFKLKK